MNTMYNVEIQMLGECERTAVLDEQIGNALGFVESDIDERELYRMTALFNSEDNPGSMKCKMQKFLKEHQEILYMDVIFHESAHDLPQRFVVWGDGKIQNYRTRVIYEEVK